MDKLRISDNRRYFVKEDGTPFIWLADTNWTMPQRLKWDDVDYLMQTRKSQGFTVLQIVALDPERDIEMRNPAGIKALENDDITKPVEEYFRYLDYILDTAEKHGLYVMLLPVWGQLVTGDGWGGETFAKTVTVENAHWFGEWIGNRYKDRTNIIWCLGGDRQPIHRQKYDYREVWRRMAEGLAKGVLGKNLVYNQNEEEWKELLLTYHTCHEMETGECSTMSYWTDEEKWIQFIMLQSGHGEIPRNFDLVAKEYFRKENGIWRTMPVWDGEPAYEAMPNGFPNFTARHGSWMVRKRAYWALFAGAFGHTYGHCNMWCSVGQKELNHFSHNTWYDALHSEGSVQIKYLRDFLEAFPLAECVPCQEVVISEETCMEDHVQAIRHKDGAFLCAYLPSGGECRLAIDGADKGYAGRLCYGTWFDPRTGTCSEVFELNNDKAMLFTAPACGPEKDYVLILTAEEKDCQVASGDYGAAWGEEEAKKVFVW